MIRSTLYTLSTRYSPTAVSAVIIRPAAVVLSGKLSGRWFSANPKRDETLVNKNYDDRFDESDALEKGKEAATHLKRDRAALPIGRHATRYHSPFFGGPLFRGFDDFFTRDPFAPMFSRDPFFRRDPFSDIMPVLRNFPVDENKTLLRSTPGYEIKESAGMYEIAIEIPDGVDASDMTVELEDDGTMLHVHGSSKVEEDGKVVSSMRFDKRFSIGTNVVTDKITANLDEGLLVLKAPKLEPDTAEPPKRTIAITQKPHSSLEEQVVQKSYTDAFDESDWAETGKVGHEEDKP